MRIEIGIEIDGVIGKLAGFLGSDHCPVTMELHPDHCDPPRQKREENNKEGCTEKEEGRRIVGTSKVEESSLLTSLKGKSKEGMKGGERDEDRREEVLRGHENGHVANARFLQQENILNLPEPSARVSIASPQVHKAHVQQAIHSSPKTAFENTLCRDVENNRFERNNTQLGIDILDKEPTPRNYSSLAQSENIPYYVKKARRGEAVIEGKVPDSKVMNSGGFFR